ncbi:hypothetical protein N9094_01245 [bacterium]|jgi:hypothetical protein|nr:hypothetical protein [Verrucomicrobiales bacterium]MDA7643852.1 hypothetical protein [Verrucomicrobiales bacterium]MDB4507810.1 hypothetical protein [bacterium]
MDQEHTQQSSRILLGLVALLTISSCQVVPDIPEEELPVLSDTLIPESVPAPTSFRNVDRQEAILLARRYASYRWTPTKRNIWHGYDEQGIRVDTPDEEFRSPGIRPGWWKPGIENQGIPYQWGGFATIEEFDQALTNGFAAGDILTTEKRAMLSEGRPTVSQAATGIDASGLVSRCWKLDRNYTTRELEKFCTVLESYDELKPGDALNLSGVHVILFEQFAGSEKKALLGYEAGSPPSWKVLYDRLPVSHLKRLGYQPLRLKHITESPDDAKVLGLRSATPPAPPATVVDDADAPFL